MISVGMQAAVMMFLFCAEMVIFQRLLAMAASPGWGSQHPQGAGLDCLFSETLWDQRYWVYLMPKATGRGTQRFEFGCVFPDSVIASPAFLFLPIASQD